MEDEVEPSIFCMAVEAVWVCLCLCVCVFASCSLFWSRSSSVEMTPGWYRSMSPTVTMNMYCLLCLVHISELSLEWIWEEWIRNKSIN